MIDMPAKNAETAPAVKEEIAKDDTVKNDTVKNTPKTYTVTVDNNSSFCGIGAGGVQFANGKAEITSNRMADWFIEHDGYTVTAQ